MREKIQKLIFPEGLSYDKNLQAFRTVKINSVIAEIARLASGLGDNEKGLPPFLWWQSLFAERKGFEPPVPCGTHAFQACSIDHSDTSPFILLFLPEAILLSLLIFFFLLNFYNTFLFLTPPHVFLPIPNILFSKG